MGYSGPFSYVANETSRKREMLKVIFNFIFYSVSTATEIELKSKIPELVMNYTS